MSTHQTHAHERDSRMANHLTYLILLWTSAELIGAGHLSCNRSTFEDYINIYCTPNFNQSMESVNYHENCAWPAAKRQYHDLIRCIEVVAFNTKCTEAHLREDIFLEVHRVYFSLCHWPAPQDPDLPILLVLIMPCVITTLLIPFLCAHVIPDESHGF